MKLKVYNGELFERTKLWYTIFILIFVLIFILSAYYKNIVGIILMFFLLGAYIYYGIINIHEINLSISESGLLVDQKIIPWASLVGFCIEIDSHTKVVKNIVLVTNRGHNIYTISDQVDNIAIFLETLEQFLPMMPDFHQTFWEKFSRRVKL